MRNLNINFNNTDLIVLVIKIVKAHVKNQDNNHHNFNINKVDRILNNKC